MVNYFFDNFYWEVILQNALFFVDVMRMKFIIDITMNEVQNAFSPEGNLFQGSFCWAEIKSF